MPDSQLDAISAARQLKQIQAEREKRAQTEYIPPRQFAGESFIEPAISVASGIVNTVAGGLGGIAAQAVPGGRTGADVVNAMQSNVFAPTTEGGKRGLQTLGDLVESGIDVLRFPLSGLAGLGEMFAGQGIDQAVKTVRGTQAEGLGVTAGNRVFEETGSPLLATIARTTPDAALEIGALAGIRPALSAATKAVPSAIQTGRDIAETVSFVTQTPTRRRITELLESGSTDRETAGFRLSNNQQFIPSGEAAATSRLPEYMRIGRERAVRDPFQSAAIKQGFDEGVVATIRGASGADRSKMAEMLDILEQGKKNTRYAAQFRPSDVVGRSAIDRLTAVRNANLDAGRALDGEAQKLRGQRVDVSGPVNQFLDDLDSIGVSLNDDLSPNFAGSDIEGLAAPEAAIRRLASRMASNGPVDAYEMHRLKRYIDESVSYGRAGEGLSGRVEGIMKTLRRNLDGVLDESFPDYNAVNTKYSETIGALDGFQQAVGKTINLSGENADKAAGTVLRRILSNAQSRVNIVDSLAEMDKVAGKYGAKFDDDILSLLVYADELDKVFGPVARTSFQGQIAQSLSRSKGELIQDAIEKTVESVRGVNQEGGIRAMRDLLKSFDNGAK